MVKEELFRMIGEGVIPNPNLLYFDDFLQEVSIKLFDKFPNLECEFIIADGGINNLYLVENKGITFKKTRDYLNDYCFNRVGLWTDYVFIEIRNNKITYNFE